MKIVSFCKLLSLTTFLLLPRLMPASESDAASTNAAGVIERVSPDASPARTAGVLSSLQNAGINAEFAYRAEALSKLHGGLTKEKGIAYLGSIETAFTFDYKVRIARHLAVTPDLQWVHKPDSGSRDAVLAGVRVALLF